jgi:hypothetical protein
MHSHHIAHRCDFYFLSSLISARDLKPDNLLVDFQVALPSPSFPLTIARVTSRFLILEFRFSSKRTSQSLR